MTSDQEFSALLAFVQSESRICPMPIQWNELWNMLPGKPKYAGNVEPYPPLVLAGWWASTTDQKPSASPITFAGRTNTVHLSK